MIGTSQIILPVLDVMGGQVVRGIGGRRHEYRPIVSKLVDSAEPLAVARAFRTHFGFTEIYLADLDAIRHGNPALGTYVRLQDDGFQLWIDAGLRTSRDDVLSNLLGCESARIVVGLESVHGSVALAQILERAGPERTVFSLDLMAGQSLGRSDLWHTAEPLEIAECAIAEGVRQLIVLDLANVGVGKGVGTEELCQRIRAAHPEIQLIAGGGVRSVEDVKRLQSVGVDRVMVATALHDGLISA